jgi:hypothetical protein
MNLPPVSDRIHLVFSPQLQLPYHELLPGNFGPSAESKPTCIPTEALKKFLNPLRVTEFHKSHFEQAPLFLPPTAGRKKLFQLKEFSPDFFFRNSRIPDGTITMLDGPNKKVSTKRKYSIIEKRGLQNFVEKSKGSLIIGGTHYYHPAWQQVVESFSKSFGSFVSTNAYITPTQEQTFFQHWDDHDVFVVQLSGIKHWDIYEATVDKPLYGMIDCPVTKKILTVTLEPGSMLYIPRGFPHKARAADEASFHLTIGLNTLRRYDILQYSLKHLLQKAAMDPYFREVFNRNDRQKTSSLHSAFASFCNRMKTYLSDQDLETFAQICDLKHQTLHPALVKRKDAPEFLDPLSKQKFEHTKAAYIKLQRSRHQQIRVLFPGGQMSVPRHYQKSLRRSLLGKPFQIQDLQKLGLKKKEASHLIESLLRSGLLEVSA